MDGATKETLKYLIEEKMTTMITIIVAIIVIIVIGLCIKFACYHVVMHSLEFNYSHYLLIFKIILIILCSLCRQCGI